MTTPAERIAQIHQESDGPYGVPRVTAELKDEGVRVNHKRVERVMRKFHIVGLHLRKKAGPHDHPRAVGDAGAGPAAARLHRPMASPGP